MYEKNIKKIVKVIFSILFVASCLLFNKEVLADSVYDDGYAYRYVSEPTYNSTNNTYDFTYRIFTQSGLYDGSISVPSSIYSNYSWILLLNRYGQKCLFVYPNSSSVKNIYQNYRYNKFFWSWNSNDNNWNGHTYYWADTNETSFSWSDVNSNQSVSWDDRINPQYVLYSKNMILKFYDSSSGQSLTYTDSRIIDDDRLECPDLWYRPAQRFSFIFK